jgi:hypothetical protein
VPTLPYRRWSLSVLDIVYVAVILALAALIALIAKGVEKL